MWWLQAFCKEYLEGWEAADEGDNSMLGNHTPGRRTRQPGEGLLRPHVKCLVLTVAVLVSFGGSLGAGVAGTPHQGTIEGVLSLIWGDGSPRTPGTVGPLPLLADSAGNIVELRLSEEQVAPLGGLLVLNGKRIIVQGSWTAVPSLISAGVVFDVSSIDFAPGTGPAAVAPVSGSQPWVSVLCKFSDSNAEPKNLAYFQDMFGSSYPGLDHYWREVSYNNIDIVGSQAHGWYTLPQPRSYYVDGSGNADLDKLFADCTQVADTEIYYPAFVGINLMFNEDIGPYAWGGNRWATLDGQTKIWRVTWEPPWGYGNICVMSHEMGHGFGLPHSTFGDDSNPYDNAWDVMSDTWSYTINDATYGHVGQHTISYHKSERLGWLRPPEEVTTGSGSSTTVRLERLAQPQWPGPKEVKIPIAGSNSHFYTVEARRMAGYDQSLPGEGVIIHEVDTSRTEPAHVQGSDGATGAIWSPGEVFRDSANGIGIAVTGTSDTGYTVAVASGSGMAAGSVTVDAHAGSGTSSNTNGLLEPGESVLLEPSWTNVSLGTLSPGGALSDFTGPAGASYTIGDSSADYGSVASGTTAGCAGTGDCFRIVVSRPSSRPAQHWDATVRETLSTGAVTMYVIHVGESFTDTETWRWFYPYVETIYHNGITTGWSGTDYAPFLAVKRWHMAMFLARALTGSQTFPVTGTVPGMGDYNCTAGGTSVFSDVAPGDSMCAAIHYIASRRVTVGCRPGEYCSYQPVKRYQMALFLARAMTNELEFPRTGTVPGRGSYDCSAGGSSVFSDVEPTDSTCTAIHFIAAKGVTTGCDADRFCPQDEVTRAQMAAFLVRAFQLSLD